MSGSFASSLSRALSGRPRSTTSRRPSASSSTQLPPTSAAPRWMQALNPSRWPHRRVDYPVSTIWVYPVVSGSSRSSDGLSRQILPSTGLPHIARVPGLEGGQVGDERSRPGSQTRRWPAGCRPRRESQSRPFSATAPRLIYPCNQSRRRSVKPDSQSFVPSSS